MQSRDPQAVVETSPSGPVSPFHESQMLLLDTGNSWAGVSPSPHCLAPSSPSKACSGMSSVPGAWDQASPSHGRWIPWRCRGDGPGEKSLASHSYGAVCPRLRCPVSWQRLRLISPGIPPPCHPLPRPGDVGEGEVPVPHPAWWRWGRDPHLAGSSGASRQRGAGISRKSWRWLRRAPKLFAALQISRGSICLQSCTECLPSGDRARGLGETFSQHLLGPAAASAGASLTSGAIPVLPAFPIAIQGACWLQRCCVSSWHPKGAAGKGSCS